ncbi:MAG: hypothetical protein O8C64_11285 [Candidatus Methanoperedens sp.]|nr:hypothetical protein [Candidatus Methanoperedens sp.]MCZ7403960.1 hypothetical protein [Candidatus Methanoperedens sp.]
MEKRSSEKVVSKENYLNEPEIKKKKLVGEQSDKNNETYSL